ncbi:MAG TPA: tRNA (N(6)-L-threonylcarbamoyladenosine(37)-C(2))-methylthiotransferase MtaB [Blattabacteriaceae bacterium]
MHKIKVAFYTIGCKLNFAESSSISRKFSNKIFEIISFKETSDIYVINTCSVTETANKEFKYIVRSFLRRNPKAFIIAVGCYAQLEPEKLSKVKGVDLVLGATEKFRITDYINDLSKKDVGEVHSWKKNFYVGSHSISRTRSFLKIQDGCNYKCSYCTIPLARGESRSEPLESILKNVLKISKIGVKEIVLTGVNIGDYGSKRENILVLLQKLEKIEKVNRFRISSIEPNLLKDELIEFLAKSKRFVPHFHIPLQSGSDKILKIMRRRYYSSLYANRIRTILSLRYNACIGVDVIVGFPAEDDFCFLQTYNFLDSLEVSYLHVFSYSERENTEAFYMDGIIPNNIKYKRNKILRVLSIKKKRIFYERQIGKIRQVLFESENKNGFIQGYTDNYVRVKASWSSDLVHTLKMFELKYQDIDGVVYVD